MDDRAYPPVRKMQRGAAAVKPKNMKGTLRRLLELTRGHRRGLGWILLLSALVSASAIISPLVIGKAVNRIYAGSSALGILALLCGLYFGDWLVRFLQQYLMASIGQRMILHVRVSLFDSMRNLPLRFFDRSQHGELMSRLTNDVDNISTTLSDSLPS
jgi:ATP-binding cassette subfamily B multidrug efflux pump